jgi:hypothetical protein
MFHVKHFGTIDTRRKCTFAGRGKVRSRDLGEAECWDKVYVGILFESAADLSRDYGGGVLSNDLIYEQTGHSQAALFG